MENRIREFRVKQGMSQAALAEAAQTSQQQIQRIEGGTQAVKLDLAARICAALGVDLPTLFPETRRIFAKAEKQGKVTVEDFVSDPEAMQELDAAGVDADPYDWSITVRMRGGAGATYSISSAERQRLRRNLDDITSYAPFFCFASGDKEVLLNLTHLLFLHETFEVGPFRREGAGDEDVRDLVRVYLTETNEPLHFTVDSDGGDPEDPDDIGQFKFITDMAQTMVEPNDFFQFEDIDGETVFLRASEVAIMEIPAWVLDYRLEGEEEMEEEG
ncbi:MAG TPA: helix-turn-helix transcriptional regulator [Longimicrobiales bacterium]